MKQILIVQLVLFLMLFGCDTTNHVDKNSTKKNSSILTKAISNDDFKIKIYIQSDDLSVEIIHDKEKNKIKLVYLIHEFVNFGYGYR